MAVVTSSFYRRDIALSAEKQAKFCRSKLEDSKARPGVTTGFAGYERIVGDSTATANNARFGYAAAAAGMTMFSAAGGLVTRSSESRWSSTGGGTSAVFATPDWQKGVNGGAFRKGLDTLNTTEFVTSVDGLVGAANYAKAFNDISTNPSNAVNVAGPGFDTAAGLGTPNVPFLISYLSSGAAPEPPGSAFVGLAAARVLRRRRDHTK